MLGFRSDHVPWSNFPFKDPTQRMSKGGQGLSKQYTKSHYEGSYYGMMPSGVQVEEANSGEGLYSAATKSGGNLSQNKLRGSSASAGNGGRRTRPMTAKQSKNFTNV